MACAPHTRPVRNGPSRRHREPAAGCQGLGTGGSGFREDRGTLLDHVGAMVAEPRARDRHHGIIHFMTVSVVRFIIRILPTEKKKNAGFKKAMKCVKILAKWPRFGRRVPQANTHLRAHLNREAPCFGIMGPAAEALPGRTTLSPRPPPVTPLTPAPSSPPKA